MAVVGCLLFLLFSHHVHARASQALARNRMRFELSFPDPLCSIRLRWHFQHTNTALSKTDTPTVAGFTGEIRNRASLKLFSTRD
ncbi:hypothetical protein V8F33_013051 [Rhypophila sp. PSN 637]